MNAWTVAPIISIDSSVDDNTCHIKHIKEVHLFTVNSIFGVGNFDVVDVVAFRQVHSPP